MPLTTTDWNNAVLAQSAVNPSGLILSLADVTPRVWEDIRNIGGTQFFAKHPIVILYIGKIYELCYGVVSDYERWSRAYGVAVKKVEDGKLQNPVQDNSS